MSAQTHIVLLRGVNVGGNGMLSMTALKQVYANNGLADVRSYINSGNILFTSDKEEPELQHLCSGLIKQHFGLDIACVVISACELDDMLAHAPVWWGGGANANATAAATTATATSTPADAKHNGIFVIPPATAAEVCAEAGEIKPDYEQLAWHGKLIFWTAPLATFSRTRWSTISKNKTAYAHITIRNANTVYKLAKLAKT